MSTDVIYLKTSKSNLVCSIESHLVVNCTLDGKRKDDSRALSLIDIILLDHTVNERSVVHMPFVNTRPSHTFPFEVSSPQSIRSRHLAYHSHNSLDPCMSNIFHFYQVRSQFCICCRYLADLAYTANSLDRCISHTFHY